MSGHSSDNDVEETERAGWEGSEVTNAELAWLRRTRRIPDGVECRRPSGEIEPTPEAGERVVFVAHFERGFGLPASPFFRAFLNRFRLQPHHLPANAITQLSAFVAFQEGYLGLWPTVDLWAKYFQLKKQSIPEAGVLEKRMTATGAASISPRKRSIFPRVLGLESCRKWQRTFFYVKSSAAPELINLPPFSLAPPTEQYNWGFNPKELILDVNFAHDLLVEYMAAKQLTSDDLLRTFISRRVCPLQTRAHKICHMSGPLDPTRVSRKLLSKAQVAQRVRAIARTNMADDWEWGVEPFERERRAPNVSFFRAFSVRGTSIPKYRLSAPFY